MQLRGGFWAPGLNPEAVAEVLEGGLHLGSFLCDWAWQAPMCPPTHNRNLSSSYDNRGQWCLSWITGS